MTPLTGVQLSLGLLKHDDDVQRYLSGHHMELLTTASTCSDLMIRICRSAMESLNNKDEGLKPHDELFDPSDNDNVPVTKMDELVKSLTFIMEPIPKHVPLVIRLDQAVPPMILSDDLKLFRSALNFLSVAAGRTKEGGIQLRIFSRRGNTELVFECEDTGDDIPLEEYQHLYQQSRPEDGNLRMSLSSVASLISSIDGEYGFRPRVDRATLTSNNSPSRYQTGSVFWFSVPLFMPEILRVPTVGSMGDLSRTKQARRMSEPMSSGLKEPILKGLPAFLHHSASKANSVNSLGRQCMEGVVVTSGQANAAFDDVFQKVFHPSGEGITADTNMITIPETVELNGDRDVDGDRKMSTAHVDPYPVVENHHAQQARIHRALVIDDSLVIRKSLSMALSKHGFDVRQAADGLEGLNMMKESLFDIVLCDFLMPVMDGLDCVKQYRDWELKHRSYFEQRIIGVSAHANNVVSQQGLAAGMEAFYPKPVSIGTIKEIVESHESYERSKQLDHLMCDILQHIKQANVGYGVDRSSNRGQEPQGSRKRDSEDERSSDDESDPMEVKRPRRIAKEDTGANSKQRVCLVATDRPTKLSNEIVPRLESNNWQVVVVHSGSDALRLLKMRNWDLILMDDFLPETPGDMCVAQFRSWEADSRVNRQKNVFLVTEFDVPAPYDKTAIVQPPNGFDGVVHKPIAWRDIKYLLATNDLLKDSMTIVVGGACK
jgi:CheY-like chemotaxis protein